MKSPTVTTRLIVGHDVSGGHGSSYFSIDQPETIPEGLRARHCYVSASLHPFQTCVNPCYLWRIHQPNPLCHFVPQASAQLVTCPKFIPFPPRYCISRAMKKTFATSKADSSDSNSADCRKSANRSNLETCVSSYSNLKGNSPSRTTAARVSQHKIPSLLVFPAIPESRISSLLQKHSEKLWVITMRQPIRQRTVIASGMRLHSQCA